MATRRINGIELFVDDRGGDGPVVLFHHGYGGSHDSWVPVVDRLRDRYRCVLMDGRGAGDSARPDDGYTLAEYAADVLGVVDDLGVERFTYVGHSMGGGIGYVLGLEHADRLDRLVLVAPIPAAGVDVPEDVRTLMRALWEGRDEALLVRQAMLGAARPERMDEATARRRVARTLSVSVGHYDESWADMTAFDVSGRLGTLTTPTLMVAGAADALVRANLTDYLALPNASLHVFHRVGHLVPVEVPEELADLIADFVEQGVVTAQTLIARILRG